MLTLLFLALLLTTAGARIIIGGNPNTWEPSENCKTCVFVAGSVENKLLENPQLCKDDLCNFIKKELSNPEQFCKSIKMC